MCMAYYGIAGTYLTQFYTDVLGLSGVVLTMMPVFLRSLMPLPISSWVSLIDKRPDRERQDLIFNIRCADHAYRYYALQCAKGKAKVYSWYGLSLVTLFSLPLPIPSTICHIR